MPHDQKSPQPRELLTNLLSEVQRYNGLVDFEETKSRLQSDINRLNGEKAERDEQLFAVIKEIRIKQSELKQMDTSVRREIERQHDERRRRVQQEYEVAQGALRELQSDIEASRKHLVEADQSIASNIELNDELSRSIEQKQAERDDLSIKASDALIRYNTYVKQADDAKAVNAELDKETKRLTAERDKTVNLLDIDVAKIKEQGETHKRQLQTQIGDLQESLLSYKLELETLKRNDKKRVDDIKDAEETITIKRSALKREQDELEVAKRRLSRMT